VLEIAFPGEGRRRKFQWLSQADYLDGEGAVVGDSPPAMASRQSAYHAYLVSNPG
jgi:hypothetical protein